MSSGTTSGSAEAADERAGGPAAPCVMLAGVDDWMWVPGAKVQGHRAVVRQDDRGAVVRCSCGHPFLDQPSEHAAFLALVLHLGAAVRDGAAVTTGGGGDDDDGGGLAGVREPRGPVPPRGSGGVELDLP